MIGALDFVSRQLMVVTSQTKRRPERLSKGIALLERLDHIHGTSLPRFGRLFCFARGRITPCPLAKPGAACPPVAIVLDNGPIHTSQATRAALAARKPWLARYPL
jgi:hypothetical protein